MSGWLWTKPAPKPNSLEAIEEDLEQRNAAQGGMPKLGQMPDGSYPGMPGMPGGPGGPNGPGKPKQPEKPKAYSGYDPTGLERAAKALRELKESKHAEEALRITEKQEETSQMQAQARKAEIELKIAEQATQQARVFEEEKRKTLKEQQKYNQQNEQYSDRLARKRHDDQLSQQKANNDEILRRQEESVKTQEQMRRDTVKYQEDMRHANDMERVKAEISGKAKIERDNHDLNKEKIKLEGAEKRETAMQALNSFRNMVGTGLDTLINNKDKAMGFAFATGLIACSIYGAKHGIGTSMRLIEARIGKPTLVRETTRFNYKDTLRHPISTLVKKLGFGAKPDAMEGVVMNPTLDARLRVLAASTHFTKKNGGTYRNVLMYGPPGTGKTLFAKKLAQTSGMDYAILTGGDVAPMGKEGVTAIHKTFDWSTTSRKGLLLFVDESEAFLRKRTEHMSEDMRAALNAFLYRTGESSPNFMLVMASNRPDDLDWAVTSRCDEMVCIDLPGLEERHNLLKLYYKQFIGDLVESKKIETEEYDVDEVLEKIAGQTEGFSGREINKLAISLQASVYASPDLLFRERMLYERLQEMMQANQQKAVWSKDEAIDIIDTVPTPS